jgi:O-antigen ligase
MSGPWFSESGRLLLGWDSPIPAGLFLAMLLPWTMVAMLAFPERRALRWIAYGVSWGISGLLLVLLAMAQSRGPIAAAGFSFAIGWWYAGRLAPSQRALARQWFVGAFIGLVLACSIAGVGTRLRPGALVDDGSVRNRLAIWRAAPELLFQRPITGLGSGESGYFYSQWYQPPATDYLYRGVLNSYFEVGIEHGIGAFAGTIGAAAFFAIAWVLIRHDSATNAKLRGAFLAANLSLLVYAVGSVTSVFASYGSLSWFALIDLAACTAALCRWGESRALWRGLGLAALFAGACTLVAWSAVRRTSEVTVQASPGHTVELLRTQQRVGAEVATVVVDREVLGVTYGNALRSLLKKSGSFDGFLVTDPRFPLSDDTLNGRSSVVLFGRASRFLRRITAKQVQHVLLVHPGTLPDELPDGIAAEVWLPMGDELGGAGAWKTWALRNGAVVRQTGAIGQFLDGNGVGL